MPSGLTLNELFHEEGYPYDSYKWYNCDKDMAYISKFAPELVLWLDGKGEEFGDFWIAYFKNGKMQFIKAEIRYDLYDESKLEELS